MSSTKAKKEAKLKARKTSLSKKTNEELIDIILKKDNTERKNNDKIMNLTKKVDDLNVVISAKEDQVDIWAKQATEAEKANDEYTNKINLLSVEVDKIREKYNTSRKELDFYHKDIETIKLYKIIGVSSIIVNIILLIIMSLR